MIDKCTLTINYRINELGERKVSKVNIRESTEELEVEMLSPYATLSSKTKGREHYQERCEIRTEFQRDRDRIVHSKAFRRLKHKTQVFISPEGDHYRTRLTHTLEVSQIARTISRALRLNEDLTEAIALGHDLGHTPFGHSGEAVLDIICPRGFKHNEQSLRVVDIIEGKGGINLTYEVRDGILNHTGDKIPCSLEGQVVRYADKFAYINHDIDDAIRAGVLSHNEIPYELTQILGETSSERINTMIKDIVKTSCNKNVISMSDKVGSATFKLREFLFKNVYIGSMAKTEEIKTKNIISELFSFIKNNPDLIPHEMQFLLNDYELDQVVCDYIAGMTDRYAVKRFSDFYIPASWKL